MPYSKNEFIDCFKVSKLLKKNAEIETYRVRDPEGRLLILKLGASRAERERGGSSPLHVGTTQSYTLYRYVNGETLQTRIKRLLKLDEEEVLGLSKDILRQLAEFHGKGTAHCNLTADNIALQLEIDRPQAFLVGLGHLAAASRERVMEDLAAVGRLINQMTTGEISGKVKVSLGGQSLLTTVMMKALEGEFDSADEMLKALEGKRPVSFIPKASGPGFAAVAGMKSLKEQLRSEVIDVLADRVEASRYSIDIPNGMLLYGPPGCGKTFLAERFAEEAGYNYKYVKSSDLASTYLHGTQEKIAALFAEARASAPTILCFDEFDAMVPRRDSVNCASQSGEVNEFLTQLNNCGREGVFVIATTNRPDRIDPAVLRSGRIDYIVYVPLPDKGARQEIFAVALKDRPHEENLDLERLAAVTDGFLASDITAVVQQAARMAFKSRSLISASMLMETAGERRPGITKSAIAEYERIRKTMEDRGRDSGWRRVGFF